MIIGIILLVIAFAWLLWETEFLTVDLMNTRRMSLGELVFGAISIVVALVLLPVKLEMGRKYPAVLISPNGQRYQGFNDIQADRICRKHPGWDYDWEDEN